MDGVTKSIIVSRNNNEKKLEQEHFVLVHGAGHGAWCWYRLLALLRRSGYRVSCVDLAATTRSSGVVASFEEYTAPLVDLMEALIYPSSGTCMSSHLGWETIIRRRAWRCGRSSSAGSCTSRAP